MNTNTTRKPNARKTSAPAAPRPKSRAAARRAAWRRVGLWLNSRSRDLAITAIVLGAFVAVFDGSLYSAKAFAFTGVSAIAFAIMPDALMVLSAAKMRQQGITPTQHAAAKRAMHVSLTFSLLTNMIAAFLRYAPKQLITDELLLIGAIAYHGMIVIFLWLAVETLTKTRADRKDAKARKAIEVPAIAPVQAAPAVAPVGPVQADWTRYPHPVVATTA